MDAHQRRRIREIKRRRGRNVNHEPEVGAAWQRCRELSLAYLDAVVAAHASGRPGAVEGWGKYAHLGPDEQIARQDLDHADWVLHMEDTPWFPGRTQGHPGLEALEAEIFAAWSHYAFQVRLHEETPNCAGFDVERAALYRAGASAVGFDDDDDLAQLTDGGTDLSGKKIAIVPPPEAARALGQDWRVRLRLPEVPLRTWLIPDWEFPGYWLSKDNRAASCADLADLLAEHSGITEEQLGMLRGEVEPSGP
jgi:hypothetical protein